MGGSAHREREQQSDQPPLTVEIRLDKETYHPDSTMDVEIRVVNTSTTSVFVQKAFYPVWSPQRTECSVYVNPIRYEETAEYFIPNTTGDFARPLKPSNFYRAAARLLYWYFLFCEDCKVRA